MLASIADALGSVCTECQAPWLVHAATVMVPLACLAHVPRGAHAVVLRRTLALLAKLVVARVLFIFDLHAAVVASFMLASSFYSSSVVHLVIILHTSVVATYVHHAAWIAAWVLACVLAPRDDPPRIVVATKDMREDIYRARHEIFAKELGQYPCLSKQRLRDPTDCWNTYIAAVKDGAVLGFVAITPPHLPKAFERHGVSPLDRAAFEIRLLAVRPPFRGRGLASALCYAACRFVEASGGQSVEAMARSELLPIYVAAGFRAAPNAVMTRVGEVRYVHINAKVEDMRGKVYWPVSDDTCRWAMPCDLRPTRKCVHGGMGLETLAPDPSHIHADVLDAWFPPAPAVIAELSSAIEESAAGMTPPREPSELLKALADSRGVDPHCFVLGAGSSDLMYRAFFAWLSQDSKVLLITPTYSEYEHLLSTIGCHVTRVHGIEVSAALIPQDRFDMAVLVNPNSPTGVVMGGILDVCKAINADRIWVDETYVDYVGPNVSLETAVMDDCRLVVCKSMSKAYALSGLRVGYLCAHPVQLDALRKRTPPWILGRLTQRAAVAALSSKVYYRAQYMKTHELRKQLESSLEDMGWEVVCPGSANFLMCRPPMDVEHNNGVPKKACSSGGWMATL